MRRTNRFQTFALSLPLIAMLSGCGGSGSPINSGNGGANTNLGVCDPNRYTPNYVDSLTGLYRWSVLPVSVYFATTTQFGDEVLENRLRTGMNLWRTVTDGAVSWVETQDAASAQVTVRIQRLAAPPSSTLAVTQISFLQGQNQLRAADTTVYVWDTMTASDVAELVDTGAHEFGHALGINGHSPNSADLMYFTGNRGRGPTTADVNTLRAAYCGFTRAATPGRAQPGVPATATITCPRRNSQD